MNPETVPDDLMQSVALLQEFVFMWMGLSIRFSGEGSDLTHGGAKFSSVIF